jgi:phage FluMu protein Com
VGRKKRVGFADLQATHAELSRGELRCPECKRTVSEADGLKYVPALGQAESSLATIKCPRCRTTISIRFIAAA